MKKNVASINEDFEYSMGTDDNINRDIATAEESGDVGVVATGSDVTVKSPSKSAGVNIIWENATKKDATHWECHHCGKTFTGTRKRAR
jgi:hypothetical protein